MTRPAIPDLLLVLLLGGCAAPPEAALRGCGDCNVVLVSIDTLRADGLGAYGNPRDTSPQLDALAADGVLFERFLHNGGGTLPSHLTMLTSLRGGAHGVTNDNGRHLPAGRETLAEALRSAGLTTAGFTDGGWMLGKFGFFQGFDVFDDTGGRFAAIAPRVDAWLDRNRDRRFFLFVHSYDVHSEWRQLPYDCPGDEELRYVREAGAFDGCRNGECASVLLGSVNARIAAGEVTAATAFDASEIEFLRALYDGCVRYADTQVGRLIQRLRDLGIYDRTLIVVTSDHGEEFGEHGLFLHANHGYREMAHIPLILKLPRSRAAGTRVSQLAAMVDLAPTILDVLGLPRHPQMQGASLLPAVLGGAPVRDEISMEATLVYGSWKYVQPADQLFDLASDPEERVDLAGRQPDVAARLGERLRTVLAEDLAAFELFDRLGRGSDDGVALSDEERSELRALGYLD